MCLFGEKEKERVCVASSLLLWKGVGKDPSKYSWVPEFYMPTMVQCTQASAQYLFIGKGNKLWRV